MASRKRFRSLLDFARAIDGAQSAAVPEYLLALKGAALEELAPEKLVRRVLTRTLQSSETPFANSPDVYARNLPYQEGHSPPTATERQAVNKAAGPFGIVGSANDAKHHGTPYGIYIEEQDRDHERAHREMPGILKRAAPAAWAEAQREHGA